MNDVDMYMPHGGVQGHAGQATMVEASRAVEEVRALVIVARQFPRDVPAALRRIDEMFSVPAMAERAFFSYKRGGSNISGSTIHLAKAVAQAWQNLTYGVDELSRTAGQSEMRAWAWDLETNQRTSTTFIVEHAMDVKEGLKQLKDLRSIYENNANMANRRLRAMIESIIPAYVMDMARERASKTLKHGGGKPLAVRVQEIVKVFAGLGVDLDQLESERGRPSGQWSEIDAAHLRIMGMSITRGETRIEDVLPPRTMTVVDLAPVVPQTPAQSPQDGTARPAVAQPDAPDDDPWHDVRAEGE